MEIKRFQKQPDNLMLVLHACKSKVNLKNVATGIKKESQHLAYYSHVLADLKEVKNVARIFSIYFNDNNWKNETRELAKNVTTGCNFF